MNIIRTFCISSITACLVFGAFSTASAAVYSSEGRPLIESSDVAGAGDYDELNGSADAASFRHPTSLAVLRDGTVLVSDTGNHRIRSIKNGQVGVYAGTEVNVLFDAGGMPIGSFVNGPANRSFFNAPVGIDADAAGNVYVADRGNHAVRKIAPSGNVTTLAGTGVLGFADGGASEARFYAPSDVAVAADGSVYVADTLNHVIRKIDASGNVTTLTAASDRIVEVVDGVIEMAGDFADGPIARAKFNEPSGLALDAKGNLYVSDTGNQRIRYIDFAAGTVTTVAGGGAYAANSLYVEGFYVDGAAADARFYSPKGLAVDAAGGVYIADSLNHSVRYLKDGTVVTVVGNAAGDYGKANGIDERVLVDLPTDVALTADGGLLIADTYNNKIRKIDFFALPAGWGANGTIRVLYENREVTFDAPPLTRSNRTMVPVRAIAEAMGYDVSFEGNDIVLQRGDQKITMTLGQAQVIRTSGEERATRAIDAAPFVEGSRTYVPVRFFAEEIGVDVEWLGDSSTVLLRETN